MIVLVGKFGARVQPGQNHLHAGDFFRGVQVHRHAAAVVRDLQRPVLVQNHVDFFGISGDRLVGAVVDDLLGQMIRPLGVRVHARPAPDRIEPF